MENSMNKIPSNERQSWGSIAFIWIGSMICVSSLMLGGLLISGLSLPKALAAGIIGYGIVIAYMVFQGMEAVDTGLSTVDMAASAFGTKGGKMLISAALAVACLGWFGFQANITGSAFSQAMSIFGLNIPVWISSLLWGIIMLTTAIYGINALKYLNFIAVPALVLLSIYASYASISINGIDSIIIYQPTNPITFIEALAMTVGSFALGGVIGGDYSRYAKSRKDVIKSTIFGVVPAGIFMIGMGAIMSLVSGTYDITKVLSDLGVPILGIIVLILATWTTNTVNAFSGGLAITSLFNLDDSKRSMATAIAGLLGTLLAVAGIIDYFTNFLSILTSTLPPVAGVMIADYWIINKGKSERFNNLQSVNYTGIISWGLGCAVALFVNIGIKPINGILVSMVSYVVIYKLQSKRVKEVSYENV